MAVKVLRPDLAVALGSDRFLREIEVADGYCLVEVPEAVADQVIAALRATTIKGKRQTVRRDLATSRGRPGTSGKKRS